MSRFESNRFGSLSDSGVHLLDPEDRALLDACTEVFSEDRDAADHRRWLEIARQLPPVRLEKVLAIRRLIASGQFVTEERLRGTVEQLLRVLR